MLEMPHLQGKLFLTAELKVLTGLRIGAAASSFTIGGIDSFVLRDPVTNRPYVPGSSLKGKFRSLLTRQHALPFPHRPIIRQQDQEIWIHWCEAPEEYQDCPVCPLLGEFPSGPEGKRYSFVRPARLLCRDAALQPKVELTDDQGKPERAPWNDSRIRTDLPYAEVKTEVVLDIITAAATPRTIERVPPGALFDCEFVLNVYEPQDLQRLAHALAAMRLLEDDALGASGSRGYGKVQFQDLSLRWKSRDHYRDPQRHPVVPPGADSYATVEAVQTAWEELRGQVQLQS